MCQADSEAFTSFAHAQVTVTNEIYRFLGEPPVFLFCPTGRLVDWGLVTGLKIIQKNVTWALFIFASSLNITAFLPLCVEYCGSLCSPSVSKSPYLQTVGEDLLPNITVIWTGKMYICYIFFYCDPLNYNFSADFILFYIYSTWSTVCVQPWQVLLNLCHLHIADIIFIAQNSDFCFTSETCSRSIGLRSCWQWHLSNLKE